MKDFKELGKYIDKYYEGTLENENLDEIEVKEALDYMYKLDGLNNEDIIKIDIDVAINKGDEERSNKILKVKTIKFGVFATLVAAIMGCASVYFSIKDIVIFQGITIVLLLLLNLILIKRNTAKEEV
ncbi:MAG: hypothetical protein E7214_06865 [Clostridium sp.]|nr:hypothetical protein [Clostridium sp.]